MWCHTTNPSISPCQWCCKINVELPMMLCFLAEPIFCQRTYAAISAIHLYSFYTDLGHLTYVVIIAILSWSLYTLLTNLMHFANAVMIAIFLWYIYALIDRRHSACGGMVAFLIYNLLFVLEASVCSDGNYSLNTRFEPFGCHQTELMVSLFFFYFVHTIS
jgi:hypothetical protein